MLDVRCQLPGRRRLLYQHQLQPGIHYCLDFLRLYNDTADVSLVNESTGDQYDCGSVLTVPNGVPQTATCPILKSQFTSGTYLIITVGNNGDGQPFAYQRQITIRAGTQQTITRYSTATTTITPTITVNCKS